MEGTEKDGKETRKTIKMGSWSMTKNEGKEGELTKFEIKIVK